MLGYVLRRIGPLECGRVRLMHLSVVQDAELHTPTHLTLDSLTAHAESTSSTVLYVLLSLLNLSSSSTFSHAASHLGVAQTIHVLLRALPYHASKGRMVIPAEITARHGVRQEDVFRMGGDAEGISDAVFEFATVANDNLLTAREMFKETGGDGGQVPQVAMPVFLYGVRLSQRLRGLHPRCKLHAKHLRGVHAWRGPMGTAC